MDRHALTEASDWFVRMQDRKVPAATRYDFAQWLLKSPENVAAYLDVS